MPNEIDNDDMDLDNELPLVIEPPMMFPVKKINYLNNKDMLKEIHQSKNSFSEFIDPTYSDYDIIIDSEDEILLNEVQERAKIGRAARLSSLAFASAIANNTSRTEKPKAAEHKIKPETISVDDLVFRVLTFDHIPLAPGRKKNPKSEADKHVKLNFFPFKHFIIENGVVKEVGRSHSKSGKFNIERGSITNKLAKMFILMVNKYGQRGNWRGYCVDSETEALTKRGWLDTSKITTDDIILSYNGERLAWSAIKSIYRGDFNGKMHKLTQKGFDSFITPNHKLVTVRGLIPIELIKTTDKILMLADAVNDVNKSYEDDLVELFAWISAEKTLHFASESNVKCITMHRTRVHNADRIRQCLTSLNMNFSEHTKDLDVIFKISVGDTAEIIKELSTKNLPTEVIMRMTTSQRELFLNTLIDSNRLRIRRNSRHIRYNHTNKEHIDNFQLLCALTGRRSSVQFTDKKISFNDSNSYYTVNVFSKRKNTTAGSCINFNGGRNSGRDGNTQLGVSKLLHQNVPTVDYIGQVWCPETEYGSFVARRNNTVYLTGNTYIDEMKGQALLQLAQMGLQFDESKSDNPFSYFTQSLQNSFTRVLNLEKKNQDLRDDLLIDGGASPSFSRQLALEADIRQLREEAQEAAKDDNE